MSTSKVQTSLLNLGKALQKLEEVIKDPVNNPYKTDTIIKRFEFSIELMWKTLKRMMELDGQFTTGSPKEILKQAYKINWIQDEDKWLRLLECRNMTTHIYDEELAENIAHEIIINFPLLQETYQSLSKRFLKQ